MYWKQIFNERNDSPHWDWHVVMYFINVFLVVFGYSLRGGAFQAVKAFRTALVVVALLALMLTTKQVKFYFHRHKNWVLWVFVGLILLVAPFSVNLFWSAGRLGAWLPFLIYSNYFVVHLFSNYTKDEALFKLLQIFNLVYAYPLGVMIFYGVVFQTENIYGQDIGSFKANVLGWACTVFVLTGFDLYANRPMSVWLRYTFFGVAFLALWGIVLTGSRSSYLSLAAATMVLVVRNQRISVYLKLFVGLCIVAFAYYIITSPDSVVNLRAQYADIRQQRGEIRFKLADQAFGAMLKNPHLLFTGFGFDNFREGLERYAGIRTELASHNSYLEVFFSSGVLVFLFFMAFMVGNALLKYSRFDSRLFVFFPMPMIVPYFESNLNAGQFLFFPWMTFMFFYVHVSSVQQPLKESKPKEKSDELSAFKTNNSPLFRDSTQ
jgi:hypothetical protein